MNPSYEYELLHQFEAIFRDGEHKTQAATRDYSKVWENVIDNPPDEGVTPVHVYRMNGTTCAVIAGMDELVENEECAMEIARLAAALAACASQSKSRLARYDEAVRLIREYQAEWENPSTDLLYRRKCRDRLFAFVDAEPKTEER